MLPYEKPDNVWISVTIEMDLSLIAYERTLYTFFELLSDVGGLSGILVTIFTVIVSIWNFNSFENLMVSNLFKIKKRPEDIDAEYAAGKYTGDNADFIKMSSAPNCTDIFMSILPEKCTKMCNRKRKAIAMAKAREEFDKEANIIKIVQR